MRRALAILGCVLAVASCRKSEPAAPTPGRVVTTVIPEDENGKRKRALVRPAPDILDKSLLGSKLAADGSVAQESAAFKPGEPVALTLWLKQSPPGLATRAIWYDADDKVIAREQRVMYGSKMTTFLCKEKLRPGRYRVEGYWGGNVVADKPFEVTGGKK